jgi:pimeloyl-ACP methyl ester carboxylesterase
MLRIVVIAAAITPLVSAKVTAQAPASPLRTLAKSPAPGTLFLYPERIRLRDGSFATAERGMLFVPVNRKQGDSEVIGIEVYRFRANSSADPATPPIFRLHGGPSFQGLEPSLERRGFYEDQIQPFLAVADFVVIGQRGIGSSKPTTSCERPAPLPLDASPEDLARRLREASTRCRTFWEAAGLDLAGFTIVEAAADVDALRQALGYDKIQIWGGSFGSHWGMAVMRYYPQAVTRAVLRGLEGPDHTYDSPTGVYNALSRIAATADTAAALRSVIPPGGLMKAFKDVITRLDKEPAIVEIRDTIAGKSHKVRVDADAVRAIANTSARNWPAMVLALQRGDYTAPARAAIQSRIQPGMEPASFFMLDCGSGITPARAKQFMEDPAVAIVGDLGWFYRTACASWNSDLGDAFRQNFETTIPTVFVHGDWDTSTPLENALELKPFFKNLHFVLVKGGSHGALLQALPVAPTFRKELMEFFATGDMAGLPDEVAIPPVNWVMP